MERLEDKVRLSTRKYGLEGAKIGCFVSMKEILRSWRPRQLNDPPIRRLQTQGILRGGTLPPRWGPAAAQGQRSSSWKKILFRTFTSGWFFRLGGAGFDSREASVSTWVGWVWHRSSSFLLWQKISRFFDQKKTKVCSRVTWKQQLVGYFDS